MKILHIGNMKSGIDVYVRNTIMYVADGFEFVVVHGDEDGNQPFIRNGERVREYGICMYRDLNLLRDAKALMQTVRIIKKEKPDAIHCHSAKGGFIGRCAGFLTGIRTFYTPHAFSFLSVASKKKQCFYRWLERLARLNSYLLACSESEQALGKEVVHYKPGRALVWHNALPDIPTPSMKKEDTAPYICSVGRPSFQKNPFFMLDIIREVHSRHPEVKFYLIGAGYFSPDLEELKRRIVKQGLEKTFEICPWLSRAETLEYIRNSLLYLTVSRYEGLPLSVIEAMALNKAVVASDVLGNRDCVQDGINGYLLPLEVTSFVEKICFLMENRQKREEMGHQARQLFESEFMIESRISVLEKIYKLE